MTQKQEQQIKKMAKNFGIKYLYLFGSQARGKTHLRSDFDFAVKFDKKKIEDAFDAKLKLIGKLSGILKRDDVDVVDMENSGPLLNFNIIKYGKLIYCHNKKEQIMDKVKIMQEYFDRQYYHDRHFKQAVEQMAAGKI